MSNGPEQLLLNWEEDLKRFNARMKGEAQDSGGKKPTCSDSVYKELKAAVDYKCKLIGDRSCKGNQDCSLLMENLEKNIACYEARRKIMDTCFDGGNRIHDVVLEETQKAINNCNKWIRKKCGGE
jgi:hypothetical protein